MSFKASWRGWRPPNWLRRRGIGSTKGATPIGDRLDITGARWGLEGAEAVLRLRALTAYRLFHAKREHQRPGQAGYTLTA
jgi:hypothetical protein